MKICEELKVNRILSHPSANKDYILYLSYLLLTLTLTKTWNESSFIINNNNNAYKLNKKI